MWYILNDIVYNKMILNDQTS